MGTFEGTFDYTRMGILIKYVLVCRLKEWLCLSVLFILCGDMNVYTNIQLSTDWTIKLSLWLIKH